MWNIAVAIVRLPVTITVLILATLIALPLIVLIMVVVWIGAYVVAPFYLLRCLVLNKRGDYSAYVKEYLHADPFSEIASEVSSMYASILKWGFPS